MANEIQKVDYSGRTVDLLLLKTILNVPVVNKRVDLDVAGEPMIVTGIEKMAQRFVVAFINAIGSTKFRDGHGTDLIPLAARGMIYNMATLETAAAAANLSALNQLMEADGEAEDTPDDERITESEVENLEFSQENARVRISIRLTTAAGKSYVYVIPVPVGVH